MSVTVSYNIKSAVNRNFLIEKRIRFDSFIDAKRFVERLSSLYKNFTLVGKPLIGVD